MSRWLLVAAFILAVAPVAGAQTAENVAVVVNDASEASQQIADRYVKARAIPGDNVVHIRTATTDEITRDVYNATIEQPVGNWLNKNSLQDRILYIVLTKGIPLRIAGAGGTDGTVASVDSELTLLYRKMTGKRVPVPGHVANPYFLAAAPVSQAKPFSHADQDIYLVTRLDGFTVADALGLIDKAHTPASRGVVVLDMKGTPTSSAGDAWLDNAATRLREQGLGERLVLNSGTDGVRDVPDVLGYYSWGSNDSANRSRKYGLGFVPGAIAATFVSTDARTFSEPPADWTPSDNWGYRTSFAGSPQSLAGDLIREGATGVAGHVAEPYLPSTVRPDILFPAYLSGFNLVEAFYLAIPHLSWQTVVVGDPLCSVTPHKAVPRTELDRPIDTSTELPAYFSARRLEVARAIYAGADESVPALVLKAEHRSALGDLDGAATALERVTAKAPALAPLHLQLALLYEQRGRYDEAMDRYRKVVALQPNNAVALNNLAYGLAVRQNKPGEAEPLAKHAAQLAPNDPTVIDTLAWIEHLLGHDDIASPLLTSALSKGAVPAEVHYHAAVVYAARGAWAAAAYEIQEAVRLDPNLEKRDDVRQLRARIDANRKVPDAAVPVPF